jgi:hypothetical protein
MLILATRPNPQASNSRRFYYGRLGCESNGPKIPGPEAKSQVRHNKPWCNPVVEIYRRKSDHLYFGEKSARLPLARPSLTKYATSFDTACSRPDRG